MKTLWLIIALCFSGVTALTMVEAQQRRAPLTRERIEVWLASPTPDPATTDKVIADEVHERGLAFKPDAEYVEKLRGLGAGPRTIQAVQDLLHKPAPTPTPAQPKPALSQEHSKITPKNWIAQFTSGQEFLGKREVCCNGDEEITAFAWDFILQISAYDKDQRKFLGTITWPQFDAMYEIAGDIINDKVKFREVKRIAPSKIVINPYPTFGFGYVLAYDRNKNQLKGETRDTSSDVKQEIQLDPKEDRPWAKIAVGEVNEVEYPRPGMAVDHAPVIVLLNPVKNAKATIATRMAEIKKSLVPGRKLEGEYAGEYGGDRVIATLLITALNDEGYISGRIKFDKDGGYETFEGKVYELRGRLKWNVLSINILMPDISSRLYNTNPLEKNVEIAFDGNKWKGWFRGGTERYTLTLK